MLDIVLARKPNKFTHEKVLRVGVGERKRRVKEGISQQGKKLGNLFIGRDLESKKRREDGENKERDTFQDEAKGWDDKRGGVEEEERKSKNLRFPGG